MTNLTLYSDPNANEVNERAEKGGTVVTVEHYGKRYDIRLDTNGLVVDPDMEAVPLA